MSKKSKTKVFFKIFLAIAVAFLVPLSFFIIAKVLKKDKITLPGYYVTDKIQSRTEDGKTVKDTIFHRAADIELINQLDKKVSLNKDLKGKILVVNFIFTRCPDVCPKLTNSMVLLQAAFKKNPRKEFEIGKAVQLISITVDPEHDSVPVLRAYADRFKADHDRWWFLTGEKQDIYNYARNDLAVSVQPGDGSQDDFIHTQKIILIDQERYIRGYYDGLDSAAIKQCADDVSLLTMEKKKR